MKDTVTGLDVATFVIAVVGLAVATASVVWQMATFKLEGGRVKVKLLVGAMANNGRGVALNDPHRVTPESLKSLAAQGFGMPVIAVTVRNVGRADVTVQRWSIKHEASGLAFVPIGDSIGKELPFRLAAGASETWAADLRTALALPDAGRAIKPNSRGKVRGLVELADGRTYRSRATFS
jgi:hypothetical protein